MHWKLLPLLIPFVFRTVSSHENDVHTVQYTGSNFGEEVAKKHHFIMFYAPWCGHCQSLGPTWEQLAEMLNEDDGNVRIAKVDCTTDSSVCSEQDVTGYPTLKFFKKGQNEGIKFKGTRDLPTLTNFINEQVREGDKNEEKESEMKYPGIVEGLVELTDKTFENHVSYGKHFIEFYAPWCGHCQKLAPVWEQLAKSLELEQGVSVAKVDCTQYRTICNQYEVKGYPTLLWIEEGRKIDKYPGDRTLEDLSSYVKKMLHNADKPASGDDGKAPENVGSVHNLHNDNFRTGIKQGVTAVKFFAPWCGHCKRLAPTWEELGKKFEAHKHITIAKVDCTQTHNKNLCSEQEVEGFPTILLYKNGEKVSEYSGSRTVDDLYEFISKHAAGHDEL